MPWWIPRVRMVSPICAPICSTRAGSKDAAQHSGEGKIVARQAASPVRISSCTWAGMPNRFAAITARWRSASARAPSLGSTGAEPNGLVSCPSPSAMHSSHVQSTHGVTSMGAISPTSGSTPHRPDSWATFSARVIRDDQVADPGRRPAPPGPARCQRSALHSVGHRSPTGPRWTGAPRAWCPAVTWAPPRLLAGDQRDQHLDRVVAHPPDGLLHGGQRRCEPAPTRGCCRTRPPTAGRARRCPSSAATSSVARAEQVVGREDRGRWVGKRQQLARGLARGLGLERTECAPAPRRPRRPAAGQRLAVALLAQLRGDQVRLGR